MNACPRRGRMTADPHLVGVTPSRIFYSFGGRQLVCPRPRNTENQNRNTAMGRQAQTTVDHTIDADRCLSLCHYYYYYSHHYGASSSSVANTSSAADGRSTPLRWESPLVVAGGGASA